jgi:cytosine/adenosine deaminase-related metal-dependent hydrolase
MEQLGRLGPGWRPAGLSPARVLDAAGLLGPRTLAVHGVHLTRDDVRLLASRGTSVVLCPRSNAWIGVGEAPVAMFREEGLRAALGTDSLASNADLDIFAELAALVRLARGLPADWILRAATLGGAEALGMASEFGSIEPGKRASLLALRKRPRTQVPGHGGAHHALPQDSSGSAQGALGSEDPRAEFTTEPASAILQEAEPYATILGGPSEVALTVLT